MHTSAFAATGTPDPIQMAPAEYVPGVCNIGPAEIARRRRAGHTGLLAAAALLAVLLVVDAPPVARLLIAIPVAVSASGYLQAWLKFCAGFGSAGMFNFGEYGTTQSVVDTESRRKDRVRAFQIGLTSFAIGIGAGVVAMLLPV